jgi:hypothetical protein
MRSSLLKRKLSGVEITDKYCNAIVSTPSHIHKSVVSKVGCRMKINYVGLAPL